MFSRWATALRTWVDAGVVKTSMKTTPKLSNRGITCMFVGYDVKYTDRVYHMWNPETNIIHVSIDVTWLKHMYYKNVLPEPDTATRITMGLTLGIPRL